MTVPADRPFRRCCCCHAPLRSKALPKPTDKEFLERVKEDIAEWENCLSSNSKLFCLKVRRGATSWRAGSYGCTPS